MSNLRKIALGFGLVLTLIGVLGFIPGVTQTDEAGNKLLLNIFEVDTLHNLIHLGSGVIGVLASSSSSASRIYFQIFGVVYALVTVFGLAQGDTVLDIINVNLADNLLHILISVFALYFGFIYKYEEELEPGPFKTG